MLGERVKARVEAEGLAGGRGTDPRSLGRSRGVDPFPQDLEEAMVILPLGCLVNVWVLLGSASQGTIHWSRSCTLEDSS